MRKKMIEFLVWVLGKLSEEYLVAVSDGNGTLFIGKGYVDGSPATAVQGSVEAVIVAALHTVLNAASCSDNKMKHLMT